MLRLFVQTREVGNESDLVEENIHKRLEQLKTETDKCKAKQVILFERFADGKMDRQRYLAEKEVSVKKMAMLTSDTEQLTFQLQTLDQKAASPTGKALGKYACAETLTRELLLELVKEIHVSGADTIEIVWNFKNEFADIPL